jgi:hypothetical protein
VGRFACPDWLESYIGGAVSHLHYTTQKVEGSP